MLNVIFKPKKFFLMDTTSKIFMAVESRSL